MKLLEIRSPLILCTESDKGNHVHEDDFLPRRKIYWLGEMYSCETIYNDFLQIVSSPGRTKRRKEKVLTRDRGQKGHW